MNKRCERREKTWEMSLENCLELLRTGKDPPRVSKGVEDGSLEKRVRIEDTLFEDSHRMTLPIHEPKTTFSQKLHGFLTCSLSRSLGVRARANRREKMTNGEKTSQWLRRSAKSDGWVLLLVLELPAREFLHPFALWFVRVSSGLVTISDMIRVF